MNSRQEINRQILKQLMEANERMPDQRFGQLLVNFGVTTYQPHDPDQRTINEVSYHEESYRILDRVIKAGERIFNAESEEV